MIAPVATTHAELIVCPKCRAKQQASVEHTEPWFTYIHHCTCGYIITESDWTRVNGTAATKAQAIAALANDLLAGRITMEQAGRRLTAYAEGVAHLEETSARIIKSSRASVLIAVGLGATMQELSDALPREVKPVEST